MRVTQNMVSDTVMQNLWQNETQLNKLSDEVSSGKKFSLPSDDPLAVLNSMQLSNSISSNNQYTKNIKDGINLLNITDGALQNLNTVINRVRDLVVEGANDELDSQDRSAIADEVSQLKQQVNAIANTNSGGKYIFAGTNYNNPPWDASQPPGSQWQGNGQSTEYQIGYGTTMAVNTPGDAVFNQAPAGGQSLMNTLDTIVSDLQSGNTSALSNQDLGNVDANLNTIIQTRSDVGARVDRLQMTQNRLTQENTNLQGLLSGAQDVDLAQLITQLQSEQTTYNASLQTAAKIIQPTLMDFLK